MSSVSDKEYLIEQIESLSAHSRFNNFVETLNFIVYLMEEVDSKTFRASSIKREFTFDKLKLVVSHD